MAYFWPKSGIWRYELDSSQTLRDYDATPTIKYYALISQDEPQVLLYTRGENGHLDLQGAEIRTGLTEGVDLPDTGVQLSLATLYEGLSFAS